MTAQEYMDLAEVAYADAARLVRPSGGLALPDVFVYGFHMRSGEYFEAKASEASV